VAEETGFEYTIQKGDTLEGIAKKYSIPHWEVIYCHSKNAKFRSSNPNYKKIKAGETLFIPGTCTMVLSSGPEYSAVMPGNALFFDTHMHIQSNNCAPLPLQWALTRRTLFLRLQASRTPLVVIAGVATGRFGQIGGYSSDKIATIYNGTDQKNERKNSIWWKVFTYSPLGVVVNAPQAIAGWFARVFQTDKGLTLLAQTTEDEEILFDDATHYYFKNNRVERVASCLLMDMSYSHYWADFGLPINMPLGKSSVFINDFITGGVTYDSETKQYKAGYTSTTEPPGWAHLFPKSVSGDTFSIKRQYQNGRETAHLRVDPSDNSFIVFSDDATTKSLDAELMQKEFIHIVDDLPKSETKLFEDYKKQKLRSIKAAMTYPLKMLPFFHYDPRRHVPKAARGEVLENLTNQHAFYRLSKKHDYLSLTPDNELNTPAYLKGVVDKLSDNESAYGDLFMHPSSRKGVFWGVKMYPRLGFAPDNFDKFPHLHEMYTACADNGIPVIAHCSRGPMCIADYVNYSRYGVQTNNTPAAKAEDSINYLQHEFWFADNFTSAASWENVLSKYPTLKIDLAHFGGMDIWIMMGCVDDSFGLFADIDGTLDKIPGTLPLKDAPKGNTDQKKDQLIGLYRTWIKKTIDVCLKYDNVYTDLACFMLPVIKLGWKNHDNKPIELVAKNLAFILNKYPAMKDKILVGSDWYMAELGLFTTKGVGLYFKRMFELLRRVSELVDEKYDVWHQFAVINPLKFMGLWVEGGKIDVELCEKYVERLGMWVGDEEFKDEFEKTLPSKKIIADAGKLFVQHLKNMPKIKESIDMKDENGKLLILGN